MDYLYLTVHYVDMNCLKWDIHSGEEYDIMMYGLYRHVKYQNPYTYPFYEDLNHRVEEDYRRHLSEARQLRTEFVVLLLKVMYRRPKFVVRLVSAYV
jgi:hypothetical protein